MTPAKEVPIVIGCINLASWIPRALVEHKITVSNLKRLIFGKGDKSTKQQDKSPKTEQNNTAPEEPVPSASNDESHEPKESKGHGRLPHTAYINASEHTIPLESLSSGQSCPHHCGGKLYSINPGILINIKGQR